MAIAKVEPLLTTRSVSGPFDYRLPEGMADVGVGSVLVVPFGRRKVVGVVVGLADRSDLPDARLAEPLEALEAGVPPELVELGRWVGEEYCSTTGRGLGLVLPPGVGTGAEARRVRPLVELEVEATAAGIEAIEGGERLGLRQKAVLRALLERPAARPPPRCHGGLRSRRAPAPRISRARDDTRGRAAPAALLAGGRRRSRGNRADGGSANACCSAWSGPSRRRGRRTRRLRSSCTA